MKPLLVDRLIIAFVMFAVVIAALRWSAAGVGVVAPMASEARYAADRAVVVPNDSRVEPSEVVRRNPFRFSNRPALVRLGDASGPMQSDAPRYRPTLVLRAIMGGPPWMAVIGGVPGRAGDAVVVIAERVDSLRVHTISADSVVLVGPDTTWILRLNRGKP